MRKKLGLSGKLMLMILFSALASAMLLVGMQVVLNKALWFYFDQPETQQKAVEKQVQELQSYIDRCGLSSRDIHQWYDWSVRNGSTMFIIYDRSRMLYSSYPLVTPVYEGWINVTEAVPAEQWLPMYSLTFSDKETTAMFYYNGVDAYYGKGCEILLLVSFALFPLFFFLVAALVCITTMTRMVDEQRTQIGTLKALGYSDGAIAWKYISYSGSAALLGAIFGFMLGTWVFPQGIWQGYSMLYQFSSRLRYYFDPVMAAVSLAASLVCSVGATWFACHAELQLLPASLMRPKAPKPGKRILLERVRFIWSRVSFLHKVSIRNILRYKKRLFMMLLGIGGCTALIVAGFGIRDSIATIADDQFGSITHYDIAVTFSTPMNTTLQEDFRSRYPTAQTCVFAETASYEIKNGSAVFTLNTVATDDPDITSVIGLTDGTQTVPYPQEGAIIDRDLADRLGLKAGDMLTVSLSDTKSVEIPVEGVFENYVYHYAYMTAETYRDLFGADCEYSTAYILTDGDAYALGAALASNSRVASVTVSEALQDIVDNTMKSLDYIVGLVVVCACALALVVLFNLCNISITERVREIATVKVLGFYHRETLNYVFREILLLTFCGALVGLPAGWALHRFIMQNIRISLVSFHIHVTPLSYALAFAATLLLAVAVCLCLIRKIDRISMAESLKSIE